MTDVQKIAFDTLKAGAPGLSDQTREVLAGIIARKVALSTTPARAEAQDEDTPCTDCGGTGVTHQTERRCSCQEAEAQDEGAAVLKGVGKVNGDGWKDTTTKGEVVFVWNAEKPSPYAPGQYPRVGNDGWSASTSQYDFAPATADDVPAILAALARAHPSPTPTAPVEASGSERDIQGETFMGFRVAAWRYRQGDETHKLPHHYAEHWSTPGASAWGIQRLFTEDQLQQALNLHPQPSGETREAVARLAWTYACSSDELDPQYDNGWSRALDLYANEPRYTDSAKAFVDRTWAFADAILDFIRRAHPSPTPAADADRVRIAVEALEATKNRVREWPIDDQETCMCGSPVSGHGMGDGHSPVSQGDHAISMIVEAIDEALAALKSTAAKEGGE